MSIYYPENNWCSSIELKVQIWDILQNAMLESLWWVEGKKSRHHPGDLCRWQLCHNKRWLKRGNVENTERCSDINYSQRENRCNPVRENEIVKLFECFNKGEEDLNSSSLKGLKKFTFSNWTFESEFLAISASEIYSKVAMMVSNDAHEGVIGILFIKNQISFHPAELMELGAH